MGRSRCLQSLISRRLCHHKDTRFAKSLPGDSPPLALPLKHVARCDGKSHEEENHRSLRVDEQRTRRRRMNTPPSSMTCIGILEVPKVEADLSDNILRRRTRMAVT